MTNFEKYLIDRLERSQGTEFRQMIEGILERYCKEVEPNFNLNDAVKHIQAAGAKNIQIVQTYDVDTGTMRYEFCHEYEFGNWHWSSNCEDWEFPYELLRYLKENFGYKPQSRPESMIYKQPKDKGERSDD